MSQPRSFFVTGGTLAANAPSYLVRRADHELLTALQSGVFCYILNTRQVGKSSLMIRAATALRRAGGKSAVIDITAGGFNLTPEAWYAGLLLQLGEQLSPENDDALEAAFLQNQTLGPAPRFFSLLENLVLPAITTTLTIFVDEIDAVRLLPFPTDEFFVGIRALYNRRVESPALQRLTFCLLGVATPAQLIQNPLVSPFNIGHKILLTDFTPQEAAPLATPLPGGAATLKQVLTWTGGHPYLTQRLCAALSEESRPVDAVVAQLFLTPAARETDDNLAFVATRLLRGEVDPAAVLDLYAKVRAGKRVSDDTTSPLCDALHLAGIVRARPDGTLAVRNRLYAQVFDLAWVRQNLPDAERRRQRTAFWRGAVRTGALASALLASLSGLTAWALRSAQRADKAAQAALVARRTADQSRQRAETLAGERTRALDEKAAALRAKERALKEKEQALSLAEQARTEAQVNLGRVELALALRALARAETEDAAEHLSAALGTQKLTLEQRTLAEYCRTTLERCAPRRTHQLSLHGTATCLQFSPDGHFLAVGTSEGTTEVFGLPSGRRVRGPFPGPARVSALTFLDHERLAVGHANSQIFLWDGPQKKGPLVHTLDRFDIRELTPSKSGDKLLSSGRGGTVLWDTHTGQELCRLWDDDIGGRWSASKPSAIAFTHAARFSNPQETEFAFGAYGYVSNLAEVYTGKMTRPFTTPIGFPTTAPDWIYTIAPSPEPGLVALIGHYRSGPGNGGACVYNLETGRAVSGFLSSPNFVRSGAFSPDGQTLVVGDEVGNIQLWNPKKNTAHGPFALYDTPWIISYLAWLGDNDRVVAGTALGSVLLWSTKDHCPVSVRFRESRQTLLSPDRSLLVTSAEGPQLTLWHLPPRTTTPVVRFLATDTTLHNESAPLDGYRWCQWLDTTSEGGVVVDMGNQRILRQATHEINPITAHLHPQGRYLFVVGVGSSELWDMVRGKALATINPPIPQIPQLRWEKQRAVLKFQDGSERVLLLP